jgi:glycyl-tRNA synthetase beta chain
MTELLLELLSEEIPARMQARAAEDLKRLVCDGLKDAGLEFESARAFVTPRRLALVVDGIPEKLAAKSEERRGPRADAPEQAIKGFKGALPKGAKVEKRETGKGEFYFAVVEHKGGPANKLFPELFNDVFQSLPWPKSMRWGSGQARWVRPLQGMVCLFGGKVVAVEFGSVKAGDTTTGHRFLSPKPFKVKNFADYKAKLLKAHVILDAAERAAIIEKQAQKLARKAKLKLRPDPGLLAEVAGLVEWPVAHMGKIDKAFMDLPDEVLSTTMRSHQKYFALTDAKGKLAPRFIVVANTETSDRGKAVVAGNERVLRARLADAKFFWDQDRKRRLEDRVRDLGGRVFHAKLGTVLDKAIRVEQLAGELAEYCQANPGDAMSAARLAKADLSTGMVAEFPELQGVMGRYYAINDGEKPDVAAAIAEHYSPRGPGDACPSAPLSIAVALADKIDTLVGFWAIDEKPTGSKDPYALRRAALGVIRLILENEIRIGLKNVICNSYEFLKDHIDKGTVRVSTDPEKVTENGIGIQSKQSHKIRSVDVVSDDLLAFFADRLKVHLKGKRVSHDHIDAVFALGGEDDLVKLMARVDGLAGFLNTEDGKHLLTAYKRAANIVRIEEKNDGKRYNNEVDEKLLELKEEKSLHRELKSTAPNISEALKDENFHAAMGLLAGLREPVDDFFDHVTVNCEDEALRENRLRLLSEISSALDDVADFSKIQEAGSEATGTKKDGGEK